MFLPHLKGKLVQLYYKMANINTPLFDENDFELDDEEEDNDEDTDRFMIARKVTDRSDHASDILVAYGSDVRNKVAAELR